MRKGFIFKFHLFLTKKNKKKPKKKTTKNIIAYIFYMFKTLAAQSKSTKFYDTLKPSIETVQCGL